jgi:ATP-dependent Zn protease
MRALTAKARSRDHGRPVQFAASIASALGGYAAETVVFGEMSTGASNDLERARALARSMVTDYGASQLRVVTLGSGEHVLDRSRWRRVQALFRAHGSKIDEEVRRLVDELHAQAQAVIAEQRAELDRLARVPGTSGWSAQGITRNAGRSGRRNRSDTIRRSA